MYPVYSECVAQDFVEFRFGDLLAVSLHAARLHDDCVVQLRGVTLRQIPERIAHAQQDLGLGVAAHRLQQGFVVVEVKAARAAVGQKPVGHVDQRRAFAPQVVGQQCVEAPPCRFAVERPERSAERLFVERQRAHRVARRGHAGGGRRSEDRFGLRAAAIHFVGLEKPDRQVGDRIRRPHLPGLYADQGQILAVGRAFRSLAPEYLQRRRFECRLVRDAEYVVGCAHRV